jgi:acetolactate synthase I/II/III large subunit
VAIADTRATERPLGVRDNAGRPEWGSDLILDLLRRLGIEYAALLPGSTFRGIHDSAVNYTANTRPELVLCNHEMICVSMARGYARVTGKPMVAILHNVVGLLNASMTIYDAWCDRVPVLILGGTGPLDATRRRPWIDWIHTANVQGNLVRDFTKWDDQPASVAAIPESLLRAYRLAVTEPAGPVYVCFDVALQEQRIDTPIELPDVARFRPGSPQAPDPAALRELAGLLVKAELPLALADRVGRSASAVRALVELAELLALPVVNLGGRHSFPTPHAFDFASLSADLLAEADVVLGLDVVDLEGSTRLGPDPVTRAARKLSADRQRVATISLDELIHRGLTADYQALPAVDLPILADTSVAIPLLLDACRSALDAQARSRIETRRQRLVERQAQMRQGQQAYLRQQRDHPETTEARLLAEVWAGIQGQDMVLTAGRPQRMAPGVVSLAGAEQSAAGGGGGAVGASPGVALGAALALRDAGKLPLAILGDGEMLSSIQALWTAAHYRIPSLWVINNNRSYYNDEDHQDRIAQVRGRPPENKRVAMRMEDPEVDFAALARTFGLHGVGPIKDAAELGPAVRRAVDVVKDGGFAVVDVWTEHRSHG